MPYSVKGIFEINEDMVHYSVTRMTKNIILNIYLLLDYVTSVLDPHMALTYITCSSGFDLYHWLSLIDEHHTLDSCSVSHCERPHIFVDHCDLYFMFQ